MDFWSSLGEVRERNDVLRHPFYRRWTAGELTRSELSAYAGQYRHAVVALANASAHAASSPEIARDAHTRGGLDAHATEEAQHIVLWDRFCDAVDGDTEAQPTTETERCARTWTGEPTRPLLRSLVALHAIEAAQPAISRAKRAGLVDHYGLREPGATEYFELHEHRDVEHAAAARELICERLERTPDRTAGARDVARRLLEEAESVLAANWLLLDGVERLVKP